MEEHISLYKVKVKEGIDILKYFIFLRNSYSISQSKDYTRNNGDGRTYL